MLLRDLSTHTRNFLMFLLQFSFDFLVFVGEFSPELGLVSKTLIKIFLHGLLDFQKCLVGLLNHLNFGPPFQFFERIYRFILLFNSMILPVYLVFEAFNLFLMLVLQSLNLLIEIIYNFLLPRSVFILLKFFFFRLQMEFFYLQFLFFHLILELSLAFLHRFQFFFQLEDLALALALRKGMLNLLLLHWLYHAFKRRFLILHFRHLFAESLLL